MGHWLADPAKAGQAVQLAPACRRQVPTTTPSI